MFDNLMNTDNLSFFIRESNWIEGIESYDEDLELDAYIRFLGIGRPEVRHLESFVDVIQPGAKLRKGVGMDVRVGPYVPRSGGPAIVTLLEDLLGRIVTFDIPVYEAHQAYESIHPFMDGNGRSGRLLWLWQMWNDKGIQPKSFLHQWYYQSLSNYRKVLPGYLGLPDSVGSL